MKKLLSCLVLLILLFTVAGLSGSLAEAEDAETIETWTCLDCGKENNTRFCEGCGAEKPYWICACGRVHGSNQFCGDCGKSCRELIEAFDGAMAKAAENDFSGAIEVLEALGCFDSGTFRTTEGAHSSAADYVPVMYYRLGILLQSSGGGHEEILAAFTSAGDYSDAKARIDGENARYLKTFYDEGVSHLGKKEYKEAVEAFTKAGDYADSADRIREAYYEQGVAARSRGDLEAAKEFLSLAGAYQDAEALITAMEDEEKEPVYQAALAALEQKDYAGAEEKFHSVAGYRDADQLEIKACVEGIRERYGEIAGRASLTAEDQAELVTLHSRTASLIKQEGVRELQRQIEYRLGEYFRAAENDTQAIEWYQKCGNYQDAESKVTECKTRIVGEQFRSGNYSDAYKYYKDELADSGKETEIIVAGPGSKGDFIRKMLDLLKVLGIKADIPSDERTYREAYEPFIRQMEEHFGMVSDGIFTLDEYVELKDVYYPGCEISAGYLLGKLADMGYIAKLPEDHSRYENRYRNMVVKAETDLSLLADGIITGSEYQVLLEYPVEAPARAENLKLTVKNDTVTLSWSKVPGAVYYEVSWVSDDDQGSGQRILSRFRNRSEVSRTNWTWKGMETGVTMSFYVVPCKYSVKGEESSVSKYIDIYYQPVSASQFISRKDSLYGKYVKVTGLRLNNWSVRDTSGEFRKTSEAKSEAQCSDGYDVYLLGKTGNDYVELVIKDYASWGWENTSVDLLGQINRITSITAQGTVGISSLTWGDMEFLPSIELSYIWWRYR